MLDRLDSQEQQALVSLLTYLAQADGEISEPEREFLDHYAVQFALDWRQLDASRNLDEIVAGFSCHENRVIALIELVRLAFSDGTYSESERAGILTLAGKMAVEPLLVLRIEEWIRKGLLWMQEGEALLRVPD